MNTSTQQSVTTKYALFFDVETTGLIPKHKKKDPALPLDVYPHIIQLSFFIYEIQSQSIVKAYNQYIKVPYHITISEKITSLTGITRDMCNQSGISIEIALIEFYKAYISCDVIVAHNIEFDKKMILVEAERNSKYILTRCPHIYMVFDPVYAKMFNIEILCTMKKNVDTCSIYRVESSGHRWKKYPTLSELYKHLFHELPENLHNSMVDVLACWRCYLKTEHCIHISPNDFQKIMESVL
jgi:DNA polymerase III epsilon subunit-like protein